MKIWSINYFPTSSNKNFSSRKLIWYPMLSYQWLTQPEDGMISKFWGKQKSTLGYLGNFNSWLKINKTLFCVIYIIKSDLDTTSVEYIPPKGKHTQCAGYVLCKFAPSSCYTQQRLDKKNVKEGWQSW